jgi:hypothetical protein
MHRSAVLVVAGLLMAAAPVARAAPVSQAAAPPTPLVPFSVTAQGATTRITGVRTGGNNLLARHTTVSPHLTRAAVATHTLTVEYLDDTGRRTATANAQVLNLSGDDGFQDVPATDGLGQVELPAGRYMLGGVVSVGGVDTVFYQPVVDLSADRKIVLDARRGKEVEQRPANSTVRSFFAEVVIAHQLDNGFWGSMNLIGKDLATMRVAAVGPAAPADQAYSWVTSQWGVPGAAGDFANTPLHYGLTDLHRGSMFDGLHRVATDGQLAKLVSKNYEQAPRSEAGKGFATLPPHLFQSDGMMLATDPTGTVTSYLEPGADWYPTFVEYPGDGGLPCFLYSASTPAYQAGHRYVAEWKKAVLGPAVDTSTARTGDQVRLYTPLAVDSGGNDIQALAATGRSRLFRNGSLLAESDTPGYIGDLRELPAGDAQYRFEASADRSMFSALSRQVDASWTFRSDTTAAEEQLPLWMVRFAPAVDRRNSMVAGSGLVIPLSLEVAAGAKAGRPAVPAVQVSGDEGKTWEPARVVRTGERKYVAAAAVPAGAKEISLRARAHDSAGNAVEETVIGAFTLR